MIFAVALKTSTIIKHVVIHILLRNESLGQPTGSITGIQEYRYYRGTPKNIFSTAQTWHRAVLHLRRSGTPLTKKRYSTYEEAVLHLRRSGTPLTKKRYSTYEEAVLHLRRSGTRLTKRNVVGVTKIPAACG